MLHAGRAAQAGGQAGSRALCLCGRAGAAGAGESRPTSAGRHPASRPVVRGMVGGQASRPPAAWPAAHRAQDAGRGTRDGARDTEGRRPRPLHGASVGRGCRAEQPPAIRDTRGWMGAAPWRMSCCVRRGASAAPAWAPGLSALTQPRDAPPAGLRAARGPCLARRRVGLGTRAAVAQPASPLPPSARPAGRRVLMRVTSRTSLPPRMPPARARARAQPTAPVPCLPVTPYHPTSHLVASRLVSPRLAPSRRLAPGAGCRRPLGSSDPASDMRHNHQHDSLAAAAPSPSTRLGPPSLPVCAPLWLGRRRGLRANARPPVSSEGASSRHPCLHP